VERSIETNSYDDTNNKSCVCRSMSRRTCRACACETAHQHYCEQLHSQCYDDKRTVQQHARAVAQCAAVVCYYRNMHVWEGKKEQTV
jgi:hypothetical protein